MTYRKYLDEVEAQSKWCLEQGVESRCPPWCSSQHLQAVAERCALGVMYEHHGAEEGEVLYELRGLYEPEQVLLEGAQHWRAWAEKTQRRTGWDSTTWLLFEVGCRDEKGHSQNLTLRMRPGEIRQLARSLEHVADRASFD